MSEGSNPLKKILLYIDGSEAAITAAQFAIVVAKSYGSDLRAIYVVNADLLDELLKARVFVQMEKMDYERDLEEDGKRYLNYVVKLADRKGLKVETALRKGVVHEEVAKEVDSYGCDLLVQGELGEVLSLRDSFYEEGERILRKVKCPVMVARGRDRIEKTYEEL
ncbi:MAG TPA: universal stress protein [Candidatus Eisenbacteria bacterium]|uniref:Universal stress protein n=1 Tax=Eiseniibacteriota bacterium TaxID=2212470 RepID=A0A7V2F3W3_UNCEI|nr:universal stress protein [Candidatus Eisenbacteria bacterium]